MKFSQCQGGVNRAILPYHGIIAIPTIRRQKKECSFRCVVDLFALKQPNLLFNVVFLLIKIRYLRQIVMPELFY